MISQNDLQKAAKDDANREEEEDKASEYQHIIKSISAYRFYDPTKITFKRQHGMMPIGKRKRARQSAPTG